MVDKANQRKDEVHLKKVVQPDARRIQCALIRTIAAVHCCLTASTQQVFAESPAHSAEDKANRRTYSSAALGRVHNSYGKQLGKAGFPGESTEAKSPNGLYTIKNVDKTIGNIPSEKYTIRHGEVDKHHLIFIWNLQKKTAVLRSYLRDTDVLWSPDSKAFIVNDYVGSNMTIPFLYWVKDLHHPANIGAKFTDTLKNKDDKSKVAHSLHLHILATRWLSPNCVEIKCSGNSKETTGRSYIPFTLTYRWNLKQKFQRIGSAEIGVQTLTRDESR